MSKSHWITALILELVYLIYVAIVRDVTLDTVITGALVVGFNALIVFPLFDLMNYHWHNIHKKEKNRGN